MYKHLIILMCIVFIQGCEARIVYTHEQFIQARDYCLSRDLDYITTHTANRHIIDVKCVDSNGSKFKVNTSFK